MPYKDRAKQLAYLKARRERLRADGWEQGPGWGGRQEEQRETAPTMPRIPALAAMLPVPAPIPAPAPQPAPASSPRRADRGPGPGTRAQERRQERRQLLGDYRRERTAGSDDTAALAAALGRHTDAQQATAQQRERERWERDVRALAPRFLIEARRRLSAGGSYSEADIWPAALQLAAQELRQRQSPRLPDPEPKRLAAPLPHPPEPVQMAGHVWTGRRRWLGAALGDGYAAAREETAAQVRALIASIVRQPAPAPAPDALADRGGRNGYG